MEPAARRCLGFTLLEVMIASAIFTVVMGAALQLLVVGSRTISTLDAFAQAEIQARNHMETMAKEIRQSGLMSTDWSVAADGSSITFNKCLGSNGFTAYWSPAITYSLTAAPGEALGDGIDNNNNGLTDEGMLTRVEAPDATPAFLNYAPGQPTVSYEGMILQGDLRFALGGRRVTIDLAVSRFISEGGAVGSGNQQTSVGLRN